MEGKVLSDFVDFSNVMMQRFEEVSVEKDNLVLTYGDEKIRLKIKGNTKTITRAIKEKFYSNRLILEKQKISLSELKKLTVIDFERQKELKEYIDDLIFALYFNVYLENIGLDKANEINEACNENKFYKVIN